MLRPYLDVLSLEAPVRHPVRASPGRLWATMAGPPPADAQVGELSFRKVEDVQQSTRARTFPSMSPGAKIQEPKGLSGSLAERRDSNIYFRGPTRHLQTRNSFQPLGHDVTRNASMEEVLFSR